MRLRVRSLSLRRPAAINTMGLATAAWLCSLLPIAILVGPRLGLALSALVALMVALCALSCADRSQGGAGHG